MTPPTDRPLITFVIISYHTGSAIADVIGRLHGEMRPGEAQVIVVDNASTDDTVAIAGAAAFDSDVIIPNDANLGYAGAANIGLQAADGEFSFIMNDDAAIDRASVERLVEIVRGDPSVAVAGPRIVKPDGSDSPSARTIFPGLVEERMRIRQLLGRAGSPDRYTYTAPTEVAWLVGACIVGRTSVLRRIGGFNEEFFLYGEDIDLGRRIRSLGLRSMTVPDAVCVHVGGVATAVEYDDTARSNRQMRGRDTYYRLWLSRPKRVLVNVLRAIGVGGQPRRLRFHLRRAIWDGPSLRDRRHPGPLEPTSR